MVRFSNIVDGIFVVTSPSLWSSTIMEGKSLYVASLDIYLIWFTYLNAFSYLVLFTSCFDCGGGGCSLFDRQFFFARELYFTLCRGQ